MSTFFAQSDVAIPHRPAVGCHEKNSPFSDPLPRTAWSPTASRNALSRQIASMNTGILADLHGLSSIPRIYTALFHRTRTFAATVRQLVKISPSMWAEAACLLVDWSVHVLRHREVGLERFLHSQRDSLYWILDDALLRICLDQWDPPQSQAPTPSQCTASQLPGIVAVPWDVATRPIRSALSNAQTLLPLWGEQDLEETLKWNRGICEGAKAEWFEAGWFRRSRKFLDESTRIYEIWRTIRRSGGGQLPIELAYTIVEDVATFEELPTGDLRELYLPTE
ncbi:hypothetical protein TW65_00339 [Stemphylium lycopersici]|uniref:Uncharacterized protein n=1 Tax=Stemphylium lycopersici TaxID=183478 RepID=A0A364N1C1_STELY|nr:hypothetical protein TW65_00339 [Stemphylium lycopersici]RAR08683.1 hypothetical protein DDE83_005887 [Stemphylium lycopersici]